MILLLLLMMARFPSGYGYCVSDNERVKIVDLQTNQFSLDTGLLNQYLQYNDVNKCILEECGCETNEVAIRSSWSSDEQHIICKFDFGLSGGVNPYDSIDDLLDSIWNEDEISKVPTSPILIVKDGDKLVAPYVPLHEFLSMNGCSGDAFVNSVANGHNFTEKTVDVGYVSPLCLRERIVKKPNLLYDPSDYTTIDLDMLVPISNQFTCRKLCEASVPVGLEAALDAAGVHKVTSGTCNPITYDECNSLLTLFANELDIHSLSQNGYPQGCFINSNNYLFYNEPETPSDCSEGTPCLCGECPPGQYIQGGTCVDCDTCQEKFIKHGTCSRNRDSVCLDCPTDVSWASTPQTFSWAMYNHDHVPYYRMSNFNDENSCSYFCPGGTKMSLYDMQGVDGSMWGPGRCLPVCTEGAIDCANGDVNDVSTNYCAFYLDGTCVSECPLIDNGKCVQKTKQWLEDEYKLVAQC